MAILILDEDAGVREYLRDLLRDGGRGVKTAASGMEALRLIPDPTIDIVVLNPRLSDVSGLEVMQRWLDQRLETNFVFWAEVGEVGEVVALAERCLQQGASRFLVRSSNPTVLLGAVDQLVRVPQAC